MVTLNKVIKNYSKRDRILTAVLAAIIGLTITVIGIEKLIYNFKLADKSSAYTEGLVGDLNIINPLFSEFNNINRDLSTLVYSGLTKYNPETKSFEPDLATFNVNRDSTIYTFTLKENLEWHDGEPITAEDIIFTYQTVIKSDNFTNTNLKQAFQDVEIINTTLNEVQFKLSKPNAFFIGLTAMGILPKHIYKDLPISEIGLELENDKSNLIIGSGPYKLDKIETIDQNIKSVILKYNKNYHFQKPKIKTIRFLIFKDNETLFANQSSLDTIPYIAYEEESNLDANKFTFQTYVLPQYNALFLNNENIYLQDKALRQALLQGTDKKTLNQILKTKQIIGRPYFQFETINEIGEVQLKTINQQLTQAGYTKTEDEILTTPSGEPIILEIIAPEYENNLNKQAETDKVISHLKSAYGKLGIVIKSKKYTNEQFGLKLNQKNYDIALFGHSLGNNFDSYAFWHSSQAGNGGSNLSSIKNVALDSLLENLRLTSNIDRRNEYLVSINQKLISEAAAIFLYTDKHLFAYTDKIQNRKLLDSYAYSSDRFFNVEKWEIQN